MSGVDQPAARQCCFWMNPRPNTAVDRRTSTVAALQKPREAVVRRPAGPPAMALSARTNGSWRLGEATGAPSGPLIEGSSPR
jgi:hypothetical protein